jgi:tetratricopeptide (TPR) repeat protein
MNDFIQRFNELEEERRMYLLDNLASHLSLGGRSRQLYRLIDKPWLDLKLVRTLSHVSFDNDLSLAIQVASEDDSPTGLRQCVRTCWLRSTMHSSALNVPPRLIGLLGQIGQVTRAVGMAHYLDAQAREQAFYAIGMGLLQRGRFAEAEDILRRYLSLRSDPATGHSIEDIESARSEIQVQKAKALARTGKAHDGLLAIAFMKDGTEKWQLQSEFTLDLIQQGDNDLALETATRIWRVVSQPPRQPHASNAVISNLLRVFIQAGKRKQAMSISKAVRAWPETLRLDRIQLFGEIGLILAQSGEAAAAIETIQPVLDFIEKESETASNLRPLLQAMQALTLIGEVDLALATAAKMPNDRWQTMALCSIVDGLVERGKRTTAMEIAISALGNAEQFDEYEPQLTADTFLILTHALAKTGAKEEMFRAARMAMRFADDGYGYEAQILGEIAEGMAILAPQESLRWATDRAKSILSNDRTFGFTALVTVAQASIRLGYLEYLKEVLGAFSRSNDPWGEKPKRLTEIAMTLVEEGQRDSAAELVNELLADAEVTEPTSRVIMLRGSLQVFAELGAADKAEIIAAEMQRAADTFEYDIDWALALADIASDLLQAGVNEASKEIIKTLLNNLWGLGNRWHIVTRSQKVGVLYRVGRLQVRMGELDKAIDLAGSIEEPYSKVTYLLEVADELIERKQADKVPRLLELAESHAGYIYNSFYNGEAFSLIAQNLAEIGNFNQALNMVATIKEPVPKALALQQIAFYLHRAQQRETALQVAEMALAAADEINLEHETAVLSGVARVFAAMGYTVRLKPVVNRVLKNTRTMQQHWDDKSFIHRPLIWLSQAAVLKRDDKLLKRILSQVRGLADPYKTVVIAGLARELVEKDYPEALEPILDLAHAIKSAETRSESLEKIILAMVAGKWYPQALELWKTNMLASHDLGRTRLAFVVHAGFPLMAWQENGDALWELSQTLINIESWWKA